MSNLETVPQHGSSRRAAQQRRRDERKQRRRKIQALAAGGLVLGVGASATLAAWTDYETAAGEFVTGQFNLEANTGGVQWSNNNEMRFQDVALAPGQSVYAPIVLRSSTDTTVDGDVTVSGSGATDGLNSALGFRAVTVAPADSADEVECSPETFRTENDYVLTSDGDYVSMSGEVQAETSQLLKAQSAETIAYCFEVQLDPDADNETQDLLADYTWTFHAQSITE